MAKFTAPRFSAVRLFWLIRNSPFASTSFGSPNISSGSVFRLDGENEISVFADAFTGVRPIKNLVERPSGDFYGIYPGGIFSVGETTPFATAFYKTDPNSLIRASDGNFYSLSSAGEVTITDEGFVIVTFPAPPTGSTLSRITLGGTIEDIFQRTGGEVMQGLVQGADGAFYGTIKAPNLRVFRIQVPGLPVPNTAPIARTDLIYIADVRPLTNSSLVSYESKIDVLANDSDFNGDA